MSKNKKNGYPPKHAERGLSFSNVDTDWKLALDPENIFWSVLPRNNGDFMLPQDLIDLYKKEMKHLDTEMQYRSY
jgi:hypothetical protein